MGRDEFFVYCLNGAYASKMGNFSAVLDLLKEVYNKGGLELGHLYIDVVRVLAVATSPTLVRLLED